MGSRRNDELRYVGGGWNLNTDDILANREQVIDVRSGRFPEDDRNCRTVFVGRLDLRIDGRQLHVDLVSVSGGAVVMVVAVGVALVNVQHCRLGVEAEECQAKEDRDRPHLDKST